MRWSATDSYSAVNHNPVVVVNGSSTVADPLYLTVNPGEVIILVRRSLLHSESGVLSRNIRAGRWRDTRPGRRRACHSLILAVSRRVAVPAVAPRNTHTHNRADGVARDRHRALTCGIHGHMDIVDERARSERGRYEPARYCRGLG